MGENVSIWDDGSDPTGQPSTIDFEGVAKRRVDLITDGVAPAVVHDAATARRAGVALDRPRAARAEHVRAAGLEPVHGAGVELEDGHAGPPSSVASGSRASIT